MPWGPPKKERTWAIHCSPGNCLIPQFSCHAPYLVAQTEDPACLEGLPGHLSKDNNEMVLGGLVLGPFLFSSDHKPSELFLAQL